MNVLKKLLEEKTFAAIHQNAERIKIENMVNEYQDLDQAQIEGDIQINQNYYSFLLLFVLCIFTLIILYKMSTYSSTSSSSGFFNQQGGDLVSDFGINVYYIIFIIILLAITIYYYSFIMNYTSGVISTVYSYIYYIFHF